MKIKVRSYFVLMIATLLLVPSASAAEKVTVERNVVYGMYSGLALLMDVYRPSEPNGYGVVFISGSGWGAPLSFNATPLKESGQEKGYAIPLAEAGYTVFGINHRATPRFQYPAAVEDAQRAVRFVRHHAERFGIDPNRIGAMGGSSGGHLVSLLGTLDGAGDPSDLDPLRQESAKVQCVVARAVPADLRLPFSIPDPAPGLFLGIRLTPRTDRESIEMRRATEASPIAHVSSDDPPFLLIHGDADETVPFQQGELMTEALREAGVEVKLLRIPGGGHGPKFNGAGFSGGELKDPPDYISEMIQWFNRFLIEPS